jgi:hypothetical protein
VRNILITGSRAWPDRSRVFAALDGELLDGPFNLIHGGADGADEHANQWWKMIGHRAGCTVHVEPALWWLDCDERCYHRPRFRRNGDRYCPMQGHYRNQRMVDMGAARCYAFPLQDSRGTADCMKRAKNAGIEVVNYGWGGDE